MGEIMRGPIEGLCPKFFVDTLYIIEKKRGSLQEY